ncbi:hypothetical protein PGH26_08550 [Sporosarcina jeotgali]|uniref:Holin n=1 Tax=Sporosarcina jeotgali TaxID=3020056 RepID=A0ABZ0KU49_9BACL|nr:hypothetical protein [Sporosarcina sp. B2O-1]WOV82993.1 hypothetical protein PGH26_08550 [Sporosarcina sp. B2O-1]
MKKVQKQIITGAGLFTAIILTSSVQAIFSPFLFVRLLNTIVIILTATGLGAFIREFFIQRKD